MILLLFLASILVGGGLTFGILTLQSHANTQGPLPPITLKQPTPTATTPGSTATPTTTGTQLPTPTSFQTLNNTNVGVSTKYPAGWTVDAAQSTTTSTIFGVHPVEHNGIFISFERYSNTGSASFHTTGDVNQLNLSQFQGASGISNFQVIKSATSKQMVGGTPWDQQDASFSNSSNVVFHLTTIAVQYKHLYYDIVYFAPDSVYNEAVQKYFQPILTSFTFLA